MRNKNTIGFGVGTSSLLMILIVLCMTILAVLSYLNVRNNTELYNEKERITKEYYQTDSNAIRIYAKIDEILYDSYIKTSNIDYLTEVQRVLMDNGYDVENDVITYEVVINESHTLQVKLKILPYDFEKRLTIIKWKMEIDKQGNYDGTQFDT